MKLVVITLTFFLLIRYPELLHVCQVTKFSWLKPQIDFIPWIY